MWPPMRIRSARAPLIFAAVENARLEFQTRSRSACDAMAAIVFLNTADRCQESRRAQSERQQCAPAPLRPVEAVRLRVASVRHHGSRPRGRDRRCARLSVARLRSGWFCDRLDLDLPEMHRLHVKEIPQPATEKILSSPSSRFFV